MDFDKPNKGWIENETALPEKNRFSTILEIQGIMKVDKIVEVTTVSIN